MTEKPILAGLPLFLPRGIFHVLRLWTNVFLWGTFDMNTGPKYYLVDARALPDIFVKVVQCKKLLESGAFRTVNEAAAKINVSRSAYYKYKDLIKPFYNVGEERILTLYAVLKDEPGVLSNLLNYFAKSKANILTINQNIPLSGIANITISIETINMKINVEDLLEKIRKLAGVTKIEIIAGE